MNGMGATDEASGERCTPVIKPKEHHGAARPRSPYSSGAPSSDGPLNFSSNVLLVYRLNEMRNMENVNFALAVLCLVYCGINIALIIVNYVNSHNEDDPPVPERSYHLMEFWSTFVFANVECVSLISTPKSLTNIYDNPLALRLILFFNIVASSLPAVLMSLNNERFEIISHQIDFVNELTLSFVDLVLLWSLCGFGQRSNVLLAGIASLIAVVQLAVYNGMGMTEEGDMVGEVPAHYLEFTFNIISSIIAASFCLDNKLMCGKEIGEIMYGTHRDCKICDASSNYFEATYLNRQGVQRYGSV